MDLDKSRPESGRSKASKLDESVRKAEVAAHVQPSPSRRVGGRVILALQSLVNKMLGGRLVQMQDQVIAQDRELSSLAHDIAELSVMIVQLNRRLEEIDQRLTNLEGSSEPPDET